MEDLEPSVLGTQNYWSDVYKQELSDFHLHEHTGDEWFGRSATKRIVRWISTAKEISKDASILDIGCGNGLLLLELAKLGYKNLFGTDYCEDALQLSKGIFCSEGFKDTVSWLELDVTRQNVVYNKAKKEFFSWNASEVLPDDYEVKTFDVCLDKGTFDAISLNPNSNEMQSLYRDNLKNCLKGHMGLFIIASCNWTCQELQSYFTDFKLIKELPAPSLTFGGKTGQTVSTCVFKYKQT